MKYENKNIKNKNKNKKRMRENKTENEKMQEKVLSYTHHLTTLPTTSSNV
jgi:hypothetical protein